jgi:hypothetical protein
MPRRSRSNGRHGAGSRSLSALNPMKQIRVMESTPPASATSTTPSAMRAAASAIATAPELHAVTTVCRGPRTRRRVARVSAWAHGSTLRTAGTRRAARPREVAQYHASASSIPPPTAPTTSATSSRSPIPRPASLSASSAAVSANRSARVRREEPPTTSGTSPPMRQRKPSVSMMPLSGRSAQVPLARPDQYALTPMPCGLTAPRPVTTTRLMPPAASPR